MILPKCAIPDSIAQIGNHQGRHLERAYGPQGKSPDKSKEPYFNECLDRSEIVPGARPDSRGAHGWIGILANSVNDI